MRARIPTARRAPLRLLVAALGLGPAACSYDYDNPAQRLGAGEVRGRAVAEDAGALEAAGAVAVTLKGAAFTQATRATGFFSLAPLPRGRHTLLFRKGTTLAAERTVEIGFGGDGQLEGVALGDLTLHKAVAVSGVANPPLALGASVLRGVAIDEVTGATARLHPYSGTFEFPALSAGAHRITVHALADDGVLPPYSLVGGPIVLALGPDDAGRSLALAPLALRVASGMGRVQLRVAGLGGALAPSDVTVAGLPGATPDSTGLVDVTVPEGHYVVTVSAPGALDPPGAAVEVVAMTNLVADAGTLYFVAPAAASRAAIACAGAADCACLDGSCTGACGGGVCTSGFVDPGLVPASVPLCTDPVDFCSTGACASAAGEPPRYCSAATDGTCLPCGAVCTPDGATVSGPTPPECGP